MDYVGECAICQVTKDSGKRPVVAMGSLKASRPLDLVFLDFSSLDNASDGRESVLVITCASTKLCKAIPTRNQLAVAVAKLLMNTYRSVQKFSGGSGEIIMCVNWA